jgi:hypothetical protein
LKPVTGCDQKLYKNDFFVFLDTISREKLTLIPLIPSLKHEIVSDISEADFFFMFFQPVESLLDKGNGLDTNL